MNTETDVSAAAQEIEVLKFHIDSKPYAIDVKQVREILQIERISAVPETGEAITGIALVRGDVVTVVDLKYVLEKRHTSSDGSKMTLLCEMNGTKVAFLVDEVNGIHRIGRHQVLEPDTILKTDLIAGNINLDNSIVMILDTENIISDIRSY